VVDLGAAEVQVRAQFAAWRHHARSTRARIGRARHVIISAALVIAGMAGAAAGGWLVGRWCLGLVVMAESAGAVWFGLMRDDGAGVPRRGERTVAEVLDEQRRLP
jgi:hypothetical protein